MSCNFLTHSKVYSNCTVRESQTQLKQFVLNFHVSPNTVGRPKICKKPHTTLSWNVNIGKCNFMICEVKLNACLYCTPRWFYCRYEGDAAPAVQYRLPVNYTFYVFSWFVWCYLYVSPDSWLETYRSPINLIKLHNLLYAILCCTV